MSSKDCKRRQDHVSSDQMSTRRADGPPARWATPPDDSNLSGSIAKPHRGSPATLPFPCTLCLERFPTISRWKRHEETTHFSSTDAYAHGSSQQGGKTEESGGCGSGRGVILCGRTPNCILGNILGHIKDHVKEAKTSARGDTLGIQNSGCKSRQGDVSKTMMDHVRVSACGYCGEVFYRLVDRQQHIEFKHYEPALWKRRQSCWDTSLVTHALRSADGTVEQLWQELRADLIANPELTLDTDLAGYVLHQRVGVDLETGKQLFRNVVSSATETLSDRAPHGNMEPQHPLGPPSASSAAKLNATSDVLANPWGPNWTDDDFDSLMYNLGTPQ